MITARQLASAYDLSLAALWRGEPAEGDRIAAWLSGFLCGDCPREPDAVPEAVSLLGGGGAGIRWYTTPTSVLGYARGDSSVCYCIPRDLELPQPGRAGLPSVGRDAVCLETARDASAVG